jgi:ribosomal protein S20
MLRKFRNHSEDRIQRQIRVALERHGAELHEKVPLDNGDARSRIKACVKRFDRYKAAGDVVSAGWMLKAVEQRVNERNLAGWRTLREVIDQATKLLPIVIPTLH